MSFIHNLPLTEYINTSEWPDESINYLLVSPILHNLYFSKLSQGMFKLYLECSIWLTHHSFSINGPSSNGIIEEHLTVRHHSIYFSSLRMKQSFSGLQPAAPVPWTSAWPSVGAGWRWVCAGAEAPRWCLSCRHHSYQLQWRSASAMWWHWVKGKSSHTQNVIHVVTPI